MEDEFPKLSQTELDSLIDNHFTKRTNPRSAFDLNKHNPLFLTSKSNKIHSFNDLSLHNHNKTQVHNSHHRRKQYNITIISKFDTNSRYTVDQLGSLNEIKTDKTDFSPARFFQTIGELFGHK